MNWIFQPSIEADGVHNPTISHFTGDSYYHLAREIIQNSLDACIDKTKPVKVTFEQRTIAASEFPGVDELRGILDRCSTSWPSNSKAELAFVENAQNALSQDKINFLVCSDFNTSGLSGNDTDKASPWFGLVRSKGNSPKKAGSGGSFGIGKGAPYTVSDLRTVFYYTRTAKNVTRFQGRSMIVSFNDDLGKNRSGTGFWGTGEEASSIENYSDVPTVFRRQNIEPGLDIHIAGFKADEGWEANLIRSVLRNFWYAIHAKELVVKVGSVYISQATLMELLVKYFDSEKYKDQIEPVGNPLLFYECVLHGENIEIDVPELGTVRFYYNRLDSHFNRVAMMRSPHMVVMSKLFRSPGSFCGVAICDNETGNQILRAMEPPTHNRWEGASYGRGGLAILEDLYGAIRKVIKSKLQLQTKGALEVPELHRYLPMDMDEEQNPGKGNSTESATMVQQEEDFDSEVTFDPFKVKVLNKPTGSDYGGNKKKGTGKASKTKGGQGVSGTGSQTTSNLKQEVSIRPFVIGGDDKHLSYRLILKSDRDVKCKLTLRSAGESITDALNISRATMNGNLVSKKDNELLDILLKSGTNFIDVDFNTPFKIALKVDAYELS